MLLQQQRAMCLSRKEQAHYHHDDLRYEFYCLHYCDSDLNCRWDSCYLFHLPHGLAGVGMANGNYSSFLMNYCSLNWIQWDDDVWDFLWRKVLSIFEDPIQARRQTLTNYWWQLDHHLRLIFYRVGVDYVDDDFDECPFLCRDSSQLLRWSRGQGFECFDHCHLLRNLLWRRSWEIVDIRFHRILITQPWVLHWLASVLEF